MERVFKIAKLLIESEKPITVDCIADSMNLSNKTIRNSFDSLEKFLKKYNLKLCKKPGIGVTIKGKKKQKLELLNQGRFEKYIEPFSPQDRQNYILKKLFISTKSITIKQFSKELYVSRVTIHNDLKNVEKWLNNYNLKLLRKTNYGIKIIGQEESLRNAMASLIVQTSKSEKLKQFLLEENKNRLGYKTRLDCKTLSKLKEIVNIDYNQIEKIVCNAEKMMKFKFSDEAYVSFIIHLAILIKRLKQNKDIILPKDVMQDLEKKSEYAIAKQIAFNIEKTFEITLPKAEIGYILFHILGAKMQQNKEEIINVNFSDDKEEKLPIIMAKEIISIVERMLEINLAYDKQFFNGLVLHLTPVINRIKYGLTLRNPILDEIKKNYPEVFGVAWMTNSIFQKYMGVNISEEEVGYIALHIAAAIERNRKPLKALIVCTSGIGTSQLLAVKLRNRFQQIDIKGVASMLQLSEHFIKDIDMVISTVPIQVNKPTIVISPLLNENDIRCLDGFISDISNSKKTKSNNFLVNKKFIKINAVYESKEQLIKSVCSKLYDEGYISRGYVDEILKREHMASTEVGRKIAIPHASTKYVNRTIMPIVILKEPIKWTEDMVDIVLLFCISRYDVNKVNLVFRNLYKKIDSDEFAIKLRNMTSSQKIMQYLGDVFNDHK